MFPKTASAQQIQRNYRTLFDEVIEKQEPLVVLNNNKPEVVIIDIKQFEDMQKKIEEHELELAKQAILIARKEKKEGKLKKLTSLADLINED
jgi:prevent-host-death family protein